MSLIKSHQIQVGRFAVCVNKPSYLNGKVFFKPTPTMLAKDACKSTLVGLWDGCEYVLPTTDFELLPPEVYHRITSLPNPTIEHEGKIYTIYTSANATIVQKGAIGAFGNSMHDVTTNVASHCFGQIADIKHMLAENRFDDGYRLWNLFASISPEPPARSELDILIDKLREHEEILSQIKEQAESMARKEGE